RIRPAAAASVPVTAVTALIVLVVALAEIRARARGCLGGGDDIPGAGHVSDARAQPPRMAVAVPVRAVEHLDSGTQSRKQAGHRHQSFHILDPKPRLIGVFPDLQSVNHPIWDPITPRKRPVRQPCHSPARVARPGRRLRPTRRRVRRPAGASGPAQEAPPGRALLRLVRPAHPARRAHVRLRQLSGRLPSKPDLRVFAGYCLAAAVYVAIGVAVTDFLLSFWVGVAYIV